MRLDHSNTTSLDVALFAVSLSMIAVSVQPPVSQVENLDALSKWDPHQTQLFQETRQTVDALLQDFRTEDWKESLI